MNQSDILELKRWNTPTIYNGWEQITHHDPTRQGINLEECRDFMPQMGPMVGYAITLIVEPSNASHKINNPSAWKEYYEYAACKDGPKIVVVQDLDKPHVVGSFWGEVNSNVHRSLGCVGTITDGAIRDLDEMTNAGFKAIARRLCVGHAHVFPIRWGCPVLVFGQEIQPGQLIHADKHGFLAIPKEDEHFLLEAARFMDSNECQTVIAAARNTTGKTIETILNELMKARAAFSEAALHKYGRKGE